jgi:hypothetical protein
MASSSSTSKVTYSNALKSMNAHARSLQEVEQSKGPIKEWAQEHVRLLVSNQPSFNRVDISIHFLDDPPLLPCWSKRQRHSRVQREP